MANGKQKRQLRCKEVEESSGKNKSQNARKLQIDWQRRSVQFNPLKLRTTHSGIYRSFDAYTYPISYADQLLIDIYTCMYMHIYI